MLLNRCFCGVKRRIQLDVSDAVPCVCASFDFLQRKGTSSSWEFKISYENNIKVPQIFTTHASFHSSRYWILPWFSRLQKAQIVTYGSMPLLVGLRIEHPSRV